MSKVESAIGNRTVVEPAIIEESVFKDELGTYRIYKNHEGLYNVDLVLKNRLYDIIGLSEKLHTALRKYKVILLGAPDADQYIMVCTKRNGKEHTVKAQLTSKVNSENQILQIMRYDPRSGKDTYLSDIVFRILFDERTKN